MMVLAQAFVYRPFLTPLPIWDYWMWLILPLCVAVGVVWKCMKCRRLSDLPFEAGRVTLWIIAGLTFAAFAVWGISELA
jgi:type VI protein secretion system component VasK